MLRSLAGLLALVPAIAAAQDAAEGHEIAKRWCSSCHVRERTATEDTQNSVPTFPALATRIDLSADHLRAAMNPQHSRMPNLALSTHQQDDVVAYIFSLRK